MPVEEVMRLIIQWIELGREIPGKLQKDLAVLRGQVAATDRQLLEAFYRVGSFVVQQEELSKMLRETNRSLTVSREAWTGYRDVAEDIAWTIAPKLVRQLELQGIGVKETMKRFDEALPAIGTRLYELKTAAGATTPKIQTTLMSLSVIAEELARAYGTTTPKVMKAINALAERWGISKERIVDVFYTMAVAQRKVYDAMAGKTEDVVERIKTSQADLEDAIAVRAKRIAEEARRGLSRYREEYEKTEPPMKLVREMTEKASETVVKFSSEEKKASSIVEDLKKAAQGLSKQLAETSTTTEQTAEAVKASEPTLEAQRSTVESAGEALEKFDADALIAAEANRLLVNALKNFISQNVIAREYAEALLSTLEKIKPGFRKIAESAGITSDVIAKLSPSFKAVDTTSEEFRSEVEKVATALFMAARRSAVTGRGLKILKQAQDLVAEGAEAVEVTVPDSLQATSEAADQAKREYLKWWESVSKTAEAVAQTQPVLEAQRKATDEVKKAAEGASESTDAMKQAIRLLAEMLEIATEKGLTAEEKTSALAEKEKALRAAVAELKGTLGAQLETVSLLGRRYDETSEVFEKLGGISEKSARKQAKAVYEATEVVLNARKAIDQVAESLVKQKGAVDKATASHWKSAVSALGLDKAVDLLSRRIEHYERTQVGITRRLTEFGGKASTLGIRLGWLSYRTLMLGRIMTRWLIAPVRYTISLFTRWEQEVDNIAESMGYMAYAGALTAKRQQLMIDTMMGLIDAGMRVSGAFGYLQAVIAHLLIPIAPVLERFFLALGDALTKLQPIIESQLVPAITQLVDKLIAMLPQLVQIAATAVPAFAQGLIMGSQALLALLNALGPVLPLIAQFLGFLLPFAPILMVVGTFLYFISTALAVLGSALKAVTVIQAIFEAMQWKTVVANLAAAKSYWAAHLAAIKYATGLAKAALTAKTFAVTAGLALKALLPWLVVIGLIIGAVWMFSSSVQTASMAMIPPVYATSEAFDDLFEDVEFGMGSMRKTIVDETGRVVYQIDMMTGDVYDATGQLVGRYDWSTDQIVDLTGQQILAFGDMSGTYVTATGQILKSSSDLVGAFKDVQSTVEKLKESWSKMNETMALTPMQQLENALSAKRATEAYKDLDEYLRKVVYSSRGLAEGARVLRDAIGFLQEHVVLSAEQVQYLNDVIKSASLQTLGAKQRVIDYLESLKQSTNITKEQREALEVLITALQELCFRHAVPMVESFANALRSSREETDMMTESVWELTSALKAVGSPGIGFGVGGGPQYVTVYSYVDVGTVSGTVDLEQVQQAVNRGIADALRRRLP